MSEKNAWNNKSKHIINTLKTEALKKALHINDSQETSKINEKELEYIKLSNLLDDVMYQDINMGNIISNKFLLYLFFIMKNKDIQNKYIKDQINDIIILLICDETFKETIIKLLNDKEHLIDQINSSELIHDKSYLLNKIKQDIQIENKEDIQITKTKELEFKKVTKLNKKSHSQQDIVLEHYDEPFKNDKINSSEFIDDKSILLSKINISDIQMAKTSETKQDIQTPESKQDIQTSENSELEFKKVTKSKKKSSTKTDDKTSTKLENYDVDNISALEMAKILNKHLLQEQPTKEVKQPPKEVKQPTKEVKQHKQPEQITSVDNTKKEYFFEEEQTKLHHSILNSILTEKTFNTLYKKFINNDYEYVLTTFSLDYKKSDNVLFKGRNFSKTKCIERSMNIFNQLLYDKCIEINSHFKTPLILHAFLDTKRKKEEYVSYMSLVVYDNKK